MGINSVVIVGNLTRDMEVKYLSSGTAVGKFSLAYNDRIKKDDQWVDEANFFDVTVFGRTAESLNQYMTKGRQIAVRGKLKQNRWEKDGQNHSKIEIIADVIQLLGGKGDATARPAHQEQAQGDEYESDIPF